MLLKNCLKCTFVSKKLNPIAVFLLQLLKFATVGYKYKNISKKICMHKWLYFYRPKSML